MDIMEPISSMWRRATIKALLARAPGPVTMLTDKPLVRVRASWGRAIATTDGHVLHERVYLGQHYANWDEKWQVHRVSADEWKGEAFPDDWVDEG